MIILDTNVFSALMRTAPEVAVVAWLDRQPVESFWITSITLFEARLGLALLPPIGGAKSWKQRLVIGPEAKACLHNAIGSPRVKGRCT